VSESYARLEGLAEALIDKSAEPLTLPQAVDRILKTAEGKRLYAEYRMESAPTSIPELAKSELTIEAARIARSGVEKSAAVEQAIAQHPDLARAAGHAVVEKAVEGGGEAWGKIEQLAHSLVEKSADDLTEEAAIARVLKSDQGKRLYEAFRAERAPLL
jgi:hypothetical protein